MPSMHLAERRGDTKRQTQTSKVEKPIDDKNINLQIKT